MALTEQEMEFARNQAGKIIAEREAALKLLQAWLDAAAHFPREVRANAAAVEKQTVDLLFRVAR